MMWVKICGNTNLEDAKLAVELGADALGFVFAESKRRVTPEQVKAITSHLPTNIERVGVVYGHDAAQIAEIVRTSGLNGVQLHGGFDSRLVEQVRGLLGDEIGIIQTLHWVVGSDSSTQMRAELRQIASTKMVDRVLIDSQVGNAGGGTGIAFDWKTARFVLDEFRDQLKVIIAGGLRPENVSQAIQELRPWGVDVVSGVEMSPGRKDPEKLTRFLRFAKGA